MRSYVEWVIRRRWLVIGLTLLVTAALLSQVRHLRVIIDPNTLLPQKHPYVVASNRVEELFGSKYMLIVGVTPKSGDIFQPSVLAKVQRITASLLETRGVVPESVLSLSAPRAKHIVGTEDGLEVRRLMETVPAAQPEIEALRRLVRANPAYLDLVVSRDERTAGILAEFQYERGGFREIMDRIRPIVERERNGSVEIAVGGIPVFLAQLERYSQRMALLFPIAVLVTGLIHYEAFRTLQGLILPLVTALLAVVWGLGIMGGAGVPMDVMNASTPILILAVAAGHAVQILKRYYEEYHRLREDTALAPAEANRAAVVESVTRIGPVMITAGAAAALGFLSLMVFEVSTIRTFGLFTGLGILSALALEMTLIPALRSLLPAPGKKEGQREREHGVWDRITETIAGWVTGPARSRIYAGFGLLVALWSVGATRVTVDNSYKNYFFRHLPLQRDDRVLNERLAGTNTLYLLIEGKEDDALKDPGVLRGMDATQRFLERQPYVGKTLSLADFIKSMNRAMNADDPAYDLIPQSRELISQYLLLYSMSGDPEDFDPYVDYGYRSANIWVLLKTDRTAYLEQLVAKLKDFLPRQFDDRVTISIGGTVPRSAALNDALVHSKILNILQISAVILLITSLVFRSLLAGLLVLVPLILAVLSNFGLMGLTGIRLNAPTSVVSAMAVGIGADYAIYIIYRLREELAASADEAAAFRAALTSAGKAILLVASAIAGGYGVLLFSYGFHVHIWMAILIGTSMLVSSLAALTLLPSLIATFRPGFVFKSGPRPLALAPQMIAPLLLAGIACLPAPALGAEPSAKEIKEKSLAATKVLDSIQDATLTLLNKNGQERVRKTFGATKLQANGVDNMRMVRFLSPPDVRGTVTLLVEHSDRDDDIWIYLPALKKVRRLSAANKKDSFMGTEFTYGDVIGHKVEEWEHSLLGQELVDGQPCYVVESLAKSEAVRSNNGYSKCRYSIRKDNYATVREECWDQAGRPLKEFTFGNIQLVDDARGKWQAMRLEGRNLQTGHRSVIEFTSFKANQKIKDELITTRYMEREQ